jgi:SNF family Na+-dependent transporter
MLSLLLTWIVTYFCVFKGVKSSSYVVWFTVPGPIVFIFIMVMNNLCLPNADAGIRMYLRGEDPATGEVAPASEKLGNGQMWADAVGQIFFSLGVCMGVMTSYSSYNRKNKPIIRDVMAISFGNCALSFFAGFAVFSVVGYLNGIGSPVRNNTSSSGLAFVAYPAAAEEMPGSNFWILLLGLTLFTLGIDTAFSLVEAISTVVYDTEKGKSIPRKLTALIVCVLGWGGSLLFCPSWGFTHFDVADRYISVYLMFILGIMQCFAAGWMFRLQKVLTDDNKTAVLLLTFTYWGTLLVMAPVTVFGLGVPVNVDAATLADPDYKPFSMMWLGIVIFWGINLLVVIATFCMKKGTASDWYKNVLFYGAHELADLVANRSDELRNENSASSNSCWKPVFVFWWAFSIKYFIPWALLSLMMWNFKADIDLKPKNGVYRGYGGYHDMWQVVGFIYPLVGLICFLVPIFIVTTPESKLSKKDAQGNIERLEVNLDIEEDPVHREAELAYI